MSVTSSSFVFVRLLMKKMLPTFGNTIIIKGAFMATRTVLTGTRTTGRLHLGHYVGALQQWKQVQDSGEYECYMHLAYP
jgi:hypothetical protein